MKNHISGLCALLAVLVFAACLAILVSGDFDFDAYGGPYPTELPAGHCLTTDGEFFSYTFMRNGERRSAASWNRERTVEDIVMWDWIIRETDRKRRHSPVKPISEDAEARFRPVSPELCSPKFEAKRMTGPKPEWQSGDMIFKATGDVVPRRATISESMWLWLNVPANEISVRLPSDASKGVPIGEVLIKSKPEPVVTKTAEGWEIRFKESIK